MKEPSQQYVSKTTSIREWIARELDEWNNLYDDSICLEAMFVTGRRGRGVDEGNDWDLVLGVTGLQGVSERDLEEYLGERADGCLAISDPVDAVVVNESEALNEAFSMAWHGGYETVYDVIGEMLVPVED